MLVDAPVDPRDPRQVEFDIGEIVVRPLGVGEDTRCDLRLPFGILDATGCLEPGPHLLRRIAGQQQT